MSNLRLVAVSGLLIMALLPGCSSSSSTTLAANTMTATIGAVTLNATSCIAAQSGTTLGITGSTVTSGVAGPPQINISIANWNGATGTTALGAVNSLGSFGEYIPAAGTVASTTGSGSITISSVSSTAISGSFYFTCTNGTIITAGTFNANRY